MSDQFRKVKSAISEEQFQQQHSMAQDSLHALSDLVPGLDLNDVQATVFIHAWCGRTYQQVGDDTGYSVDYLKDVGYKLWKELTAKLNRNVSKSNVRVAVRQYLISASDSEPSTPLSTSEETLGPSLSHDWSEVVDLPVFIGRDAELQQLEQWMITENQRLVGVFGLGGVGKTALCVRFAQRFQEHFDCVIWRSLRNPQDFSGFIVNILQAFGAVPKSPLPDSPGDLVSLLLKCLQQHHCLLVLDDWWPLFASQKPAGVYRQNMQAYGLLLRRLGESQHHSKVLLTSRERPTGLMFRQTSSFPVRSLHLDSLDRAAARQFLGTCGLAEADHNDLLWDHYSGNLYALKAAAATICDFFNGNVDQFISRKELIYGDAKRLIQQQFDRLTELEKQIMLVLFKVNNWVEILDVEHHLKDQETEGSILEALESLHHRSFILRNSGQICQPNILREYIATVA